MGYPSSVSSPEKTAPDADVALERIDTGCSGGGRDIAGEQVEIIMLRVMAGLDTRCRVARIIGNPPGALWVAAHRAYAGSPAWLAGWE
jgi:hypothetical protein